MVEIKKSNGSVAIDYMARDYDSLLRSMQEMVPVKLPEWKEYQSQADFGNVLLQLFAHMGDILGYYQDRIANESFLGTARERRSIIHHLGLIGYRLATAAPASATLELAVSKDKNDTVTIKKGDAFATRSQKDKSSVRFEYTGEMDLVIDFSKIEAADGKKKYTRVPVEEGRLFKDEIIGKADGSPNQRYPLAHQGLILRSLGMGSAVNRDIILVTQLGDHIEEWTLRESLAFSRGGQKDFIVEIDEMDRAVVLFGDGDFGAVPPAGAEIRATYRVGGGAHGNVAANAITTIVDAPQLVLLGATVTNKAAASGGADRESIEHAVQHAPGVFRSQKRAVTAEDYKALALDFKGVGKTRAESKNWNTVDLYIAPEGGGKVSDVLKNNLLAYFEDKRSISTIVEIRDVDYVKIYVGATIGIESYYTREEVKKKVQAAAASILAFDNVDFGQILYLSKFYEAIEAVPGVAYVNITRFCLEKDKDIDLNKLSRDGKIELKPNEIPVIPPGDSGDEGYTGGDEEYAGGIRIEDDTGKGT